ncbi:MAG: hypothetical protein ABUK13_08910 [Gammaproteobacteria bacterium]
MHQSEKHEQPSWKRLINGFDLMVIAGGLVNLVVISMLLVNWLMYG